jgi:hypothetical protein
MMSSWSRDQIVIWSWSGSPNNPKKWHFVINFVISWSRSWSEGSRRQVFVTSERWCFLAFSIHNKQTHVFNPYQSSYNRWPLSSGTLEGVVLVKSWYTNPGFNWTFSTVFLQFFSWWFVRKSSTDVSYEINWSTGSWVGGRQVGSLLGSFAKNTRTD